MLLGGKDKLGGLYDEDMALLVRYFNWVGVF